MAETTSRTPWEAELAERLAVARERAGRSAEDVAQRVRQYGVLLHGSDVVRIESGQRSIGFNDALVLCKVLDVELPEVTARVDAQLITSTYAGRHQDLSRRWHELLTEVTTCKRRVDDLALVATHLAEGYREEIAAAGASADPDVEAGLVALGEQSTLVATAFGELDRTLDGRLSAPADAPAEPGTQR